jgi:hypothetical protein
MLKESVDAWLNAYVSAWKSYDPQAIGQLFGDDAVYRYSPFDEPVQGRDAIVASWLESPDPPGTYDAHYETALIAGDRAVTNGRSLYFADDGSVRAEWDNVFLLRFDGDGRCIEYAEWYMQRPNAPAK